MLAPHGPNLFDHQSVAAQGIGAPFSLLPSHHAVILAAAFAVSSHEPSDVLAALRMARKLGTAPIVQVPFLDLLGYLDGRHFEGWEDRLSELRDAAHDYLDGLAGVQARVREAR